MDKTMNDTPHDSLVVVLATAILGAVLHLFDWLPADLLLKVMTLAGSSGVTVISGLLLRRIALNLLKKAQERKFLPSILHDPEEKQQ